MLTILGIIAVLTLILDGWTNKWAICKAVASLFSNFFKKITGKQ